MIANLFFVCIETKPTLGIGEMTCLPSGTQQHSFRHLPLPERHWLPEDFDAKSRNGLSMRGNRQAVGASTNNRNVSVHGLYSTRETRYVRRSQLRNEQYSARIDIRVALLHPQGRDKQTF